jgi:hypothetical protein
MWRFIARIREVRGVASGGFAQFGFMDAWKRTDARLAFGPSTAGMFTAFTSCGWPSGQRRVSS